MGAVTIVTQSSPLAKALATDAVDASFPAIVPTQTLPSGNGVITFGSDPNQGSLPSGVGPQNLLILPYGVGADNATFSLRLYAWRGISNANTVLYVPNLLCEVACVVTANAPGVAGSVLGATYLFADTIALVGTSGNANVNVVLLSPADDASIASALVACQGAQLLQVTFDLGTATAANALIAKL